MLPHPLHHGWCWSPMSPLMMAHFFLFLTASASSDLENFLWRLEFNFFKSGVQGSRDKQTVALWWYFCSILFRPSCLWCHVRCYFLSLFCSVLFTLFFVRCVYFIVSHLSLVSSCSSWLMVLRGLSSVVLSCLHFRLQSVPTFFLLFQTLTSPLCLISTCVLLSDESHLWSPTFMYK